MRTMDPMTLADFATAPFRVEQSIVLPGTPDQLFTELAEPGRWIGWFPLMHRAEWTSPATAQVGAERVVALRVFGRFHERMIAWEPGKRFAFTMTASTSPLASRMAEDWRLVRDTGGTRLEWTVAATTTTLGRAGSPVLRRVLTGLFRRGGENLRRVLHERGTQAS
jgi:hypothetical protein